METGDRLGRYEVRKLLGAAGMGEVYLAHDPRLGREVAVKILPESFAHDPDRLRRFEQEARAAASLNHPNIAAVFDVGEADGTHFIVQEHLEGQTLGELVGNGPIKLDMALRLGREVAEALAAAHAAGIVHRDIKPQNIFVTVAGHAKVLDFGLAKLTETAPAETSQASMSPTMLATADGHILGTAGYMAPEQINGEPVDHRADLFAFGCVLYRMVAGTQAFPGKSVPDLLSRILRDPPEPLRMAGEPAPAELQRIVGKCLQKDPAKRYQGAGDLAVDIRTFAADPGAHDPAAGGVSADDPSSYRGRLSVPMAVFGALALIVVTLLVSQSLTGSTPRAAAVLRLTAPLPEGVDLVREEARVLAISPDGTTLLFQAGLRFWARDLAGGTTTQIEGIDAAIMPFFAPDGTRFGYYPGSGLAIRALEGGAPTRLAPSAGVISGAHWADDGNIYYGTGTGGVWRIPAEGGSPTSLLVPATDEMLHGPQLLPGGRWLIFTLRQGLEPWSDADIVAYDLDNDQQRVLVRGGTDATYLPTGHLVWVRDQDLFAAALDIDRMEAGTPHLAVPDVALATRGRYGGAQYAVSTTGTLAYISPRPPSLRQVLWVDRDGETVAPWGGSMDLAALPRLSPDGRRAVVASAGALLVLHRDESRPLVLPTGELPVSLGAIWTPGGEQIVYEATDGRMYRIAADGSTRPRAIGRPEGHRHPMGWTAAGELVFVEIAGGPESIWSIALDGDGEPSPILVRDFFDGVGGVAITDDGRWMAFTSQPDRSATSDIWIMELPDGAPVRVSTAGGEWPMWSPDGSKLYFSNGALIGMESGSGDTMLEVSFTDGDRTRPQPARTLFTAPHLLFEFDVDADGRFLMIERAHERPATRPINVIVNWFAELEATVPGGR